MFDFLGLFERVVGVVAHCERGVGGFSRRGARLQPSVTSLWPWLDSLCDLLVRACLDSLRGPLSRVNSNSQGASDNIYIPLLTGKE